MSVGWRLLLFSFLSGGLVFLVVYIVSSMYGVKILDAILSADLRLLAFSYVLFILSLVVGGLRFYVLARAAGGRLGLAEAVLARLGGMFVAFVTPSYVGGEPVRVYALRRVGLGWGRGVEVVVLEVVFDVYLHNLLTLSLLVSTGIVPLEATPLLLISLGTLAFWTVPTLLMIVGGSGAMRLLDRLGLLKFRVVRDVAKAVEEVDPPLIRRWRVVLECTGLTALSTLAGAGALALSALSIGAHVGPWTYLRAFAYSMSMGGVPTPGAAGAIEYALALTLPVEVIVVWRMVSYYLALPLLLACLLGYVGVEFMKTARSPIEGAE